MSIPVSCPACGEKYNVRDEVAGRTFRCRACQGLVAVPVPVDAEEVFDESGPEPAEAAPHEDDFFGTSDSWTSPAPRRHRRRTDDESNFERAKNRTMPPAVVQIVLAVLWTGFLMLGFAINIANDGLEGPPPQPGAPPEKAEAERVGHLVGMVGTPLVLLAVNAVIVIGSISMIRLRHYGLAMTSAVLMTIPCCSSVFLLGMPIGIWSIVVLNDPMVKDAFE